MTLTPGTKLGTFEITGLLGKGGMGEVYRATDSRLGRDVAIKVLPEDFAKDPERLARFEREAQTLASLNHPNVATVHGFEHDPAQGVHYLVMEFIDGVTLGERIAGGALSVSDALPLFVDIAHGLGAAHEAGIVHRDLKPDNVKINEDGVVKILDFGIAKSSLETKTTDPGAPTTPMSPVAVTAEGTFMGTPVYMSPEQARGRSVDHRTDIWAFGCCLYEALTGDIPFEGDTVADTVGAIMERDPDWDKLPASTPEPLRKLLTRSLEKNFRKRLSSAGDIAFALEDILGDPDGASSGLTNSTSQSGGLPRWATGVAALAIGLLIGVAGMVLTRPADSPDTNPSTEFTIADSSSTPNDERPMRRYSVSLPSTYPVSRNNYTNDYSTLDISPDGTAIVYNALTDNGRVTMIRPLDSLEARPIPGTENSHYFIPSPSGRSAVMYRPTAYWRIPYEGGVAEKLLDATLILPALWEDEEHVIFSSPLPFSGLVRMNIETGEREEFTQTDRSSGELAHVITQIVPEKRVVFYMGSSGPEGIPNMYAISMDTKESTLIPGNGFRPFYVDSGHLLYGPEGHFMALPFDIDTLEPTGTARDVTLPYMTMSKSMPQAFTVSTDGDLYYVRDTTINENRRKLVWVEMGGTETLLDVPDMHYRNISLSSTGSPLRILFHEESSRDMWSYDVDSGLPPQQLTFDHKAWGSGFWLDGGKHYVYTGLNEQGASIVYRRSAAGLGTAQEIHSVTDDQWNVNINSTDLNTGTLLGTALYNSGIKMRAVRVPSDGSGESTPIFEYDYSTSTPMLSPDNRWLMYLSDELGSQQIFVTSYPDLEGKWHVSGTDNPYQYDVPQWAPDGTAIYYRSDTHLIRVPVNTENGFRMGHPERLFEDIYANVQGTAPGFFQVHPDGDKFLFIKALEDDSYNSTEIIVIENWLQTLRNPDLAGVTQ